jgi:chromosome segregation ATPase
MDQQLKDQNTTIVTLTRNYETLARVNKDDKVIIKNLNERHSGDVSDIEDLRVQLQQSELRVQAAAVATADLERISEENEAMKLVVEKMSNEAATSARTTRELYSKLANVRDRAAALDEFQTTAVVKIQELEKENRQSKKQLAESEQGTAALQIELATVAKEASNRREHGVQLQKELAAIKIKVVEMEATVKKSREEVVVVERRRRDAEGAQAKLGAQLQKHKDAAAVAERRLSVVQYENEALATDLHERDAERVDLSVQLGQLAPTMTELSFAEDRLAELGRQLEEATGAKQLLQTKVDELVSGGEMQAEKVDYLEELLAAGKAGAEAAEATHARVAAAMRSDCDGRLAVEKAAAHKSLESLAVELGEEIERLTNEVERLAAETKVQKEAAHRSEFERFRLTTELTELQQSMNAELPGLDMQGVLKERHALQAQLDEAAPTLAKLHAQIAAAEGDSARAETAEQQRRQAEADLKAAEAQLVAALGKKKEALASVAELEGKMVAHEVSMAKLRAEPPEPSVEDLERWNQEIRAAIEKVLGSADAEEVIEVLESAAHALGALTVGQM